MAQSKIYLIAVPAAIAVGFATIFYVSQKEVRRDRNAESKLGASDQTGSAPPRSTSALNDSEIIPVANSISPNSGDTPRSTQVLVNEENARKAAVMRLNREIEDEVNATLADRLPNFHTPLVFLEQAALLPATAETAAAVQKLRQDFVDSTGAGTTDPADPNFADRWNQFQPTADERFYAIFGSEAFNALSIMEVRQLGHF